MFRVFSLLIVSVSVCLINSVELSGEEPTIVVSSVPKSGTHLLLRTLKLITGKKHRWIWADSKTLRDEIANPHKEILISHYHYSKDLEKILSNPDVVTFFIYRDPRDLIVSYVHFECKYRHEQYAYRPARTLISEFIKGKNGFHHYRRTRGFDSFYRSYIPWKDSPYVCAVKFEDLIGPLGGGSKETQLNTIRQISKRLGYSYSDEKLEDIAVDTFGHSGTFRSGQLGDWRSSFTEEDIELFKEEAGELLIELQYEDNEDW